MASSGSSGSLADVLLCPVCCEQIKTPKIVSCGHSFCLEPCLRDLLKTSHACPLCRQDIHAPPSGLADDFPTNFVVQALLSTGVTSATKKSQSPPSDTSVDSKSDCVLHQKQGTYLCTSCLEFLCDECNSTHEVGHKIEELNTISGRRTGELESLMGENADSLKIIRERMESVVNAKVNCEESCQQAESEICDAFSSSTDLLQKEREALIVEVAKGKEAGITALDKLEVQLGDVEVIAKRTEGLVAALVTRFGRNDIRDTSIFVALTAQQEKMDNELASIPAPSDEMIMVKFQSKERSGNSLGEVKVLIQESNEVIQPTVWATYSGAYWEYQGFVWFSLNHLLVVKCNGTKVLFTPFNDRVQTKVHQAEIGITATRVSPILGKDGRSLLINDSIHVIRLTIDLSTGRASVRMITIENVMLNTIAAMCWDAKREGCYVLLHDGITICHFMFGGPDKGCQYIRLDAQVNTSAINVSEFGGMALCDLYGVVRYYAKVQPQVTRVISPDGSTGKRATCLTSRGSDRKWFVNWGNSVIQYSDTFQVEKSLDLGQYSGGVVSIHFLNERYFAAATSSLLLVYSIDP